MGLYGYRATDEQFDRIITDAPAISTKSGIAELTFKDRHKYSDDRV